MRLSKRKTEVIRSVVKRFDPKARVRLFGSRISDGKKGGDIDLIILSDKIGFNEKLAIKLGLFEKLGEQKINILVYKSTSRFHKLALHESVKL